MFGEDSNHDQADTNVSTWDFYDDRKTERECCFLKCCIGAQLVVILRDTPITGVVSPLQWILSESTEKANEYNVQEQRSLFYLDAFLDVYVLMLVTFITWIYPFNSCSDGHEHVSAVSF